jgi:methionyl-tRNA synthetase
MMTKRYTITTPIYYANGSPHVGHAYTSIAADVLARWKRLDGFDVFFLTGTDEHGQKVEQAAVAAGLAPQAFVDRVAADFRAMADALHVSYDDFVRTTEPRHLQACAALWSGLQQAGHIYEGAYEGWYALRDESFYGEDELTLHPDGTRTAPSGAPVQWVREPSYFFRLSDWQERLLAFYEDHPDFIGPPARRNEVVSFVRQGLKDLSISRTSFSWGVPVPGDPAHVMYVWWDALVNYITALGYPDTTDPRWRFWPADLHLVGKEIVRFHAVFWPAFLMAAGLDLPRRVYSHGWWTVDGEKMSKSVGNVIDPCALAAEFGVDAVRFFLLREVPFGGDGDYSRKALIGRLNIELANDLGNLAQRTLSLIARSCGGMMPQRGIMTDADIGLLGHAEAMPALMREQLDRQALHEALEAVWRVIRASNGYIDRQAPWALKKTDAIRMQTVLHVLADVLRHVAIVLQPFMPTSMAAMLDQLGIAAHQRQLDALGTPLAAGSAVPAPRGVFPRYVEPEGEPHLEPVR